MRSSGSFEFYADFNLVEVIDKTSLRCRDIETDNTNYYLELEYTDELLQKYMKIIKVPI